jgi:hypothetical protein
MGWLDRPRDRIPSSAIPGVRPDNDQNNTQYVANTRGSDTR